MKVNLIIALSSVLFGFTACGEQEKDAYRDNTPTAGKLKVYFEEGLQLHIVNQVYTFEVLYPNAEVELISSDDKTALQALLSDSCEAIVISRLPGEQEQQAFGSRGFAPKYTAVALSGIALITHTDTPVETLERAEITQLMAGKTLKRSDGTDMSLNLLFGGNNSSVLHYMRDSVAGLKTLGSNVNAMRSTAETINYVATHKNTIGLIDYAWLSDAEDSISRSNSGKIKMIGITGERAAQTEYPSQSSFKLGSYPFTRSVYIIRKTGEFSLAKGFESYVAGPKGQLTFLKQGLMPTRQQERRIEVKMEE